MNSKQNCCTKLIIMMPFYCWYDIHVQGAMERELGVEGSNSLMASTAVMVDFFPNIILSMQATMLYSVSPL